MLIIQEIRIFQTYKSRIQDFKKLNNNDYGITEMHLYTSKIKLTTLNLKKKFNDKKITLLKILNGNITWKGKKNCNVYQRETNLLRTFNLKLEQIFPVPESRFSKLIFFSLKRAEGRENFNILAIFEALMKFLPNFRTFSESL